LAHMKKPIILVGGGGHCRSVIDVIESSGLYRIIGIIDKKQFIGNSILGYKVIGSDNAIVHFLEKYRYFLVTAGQLKLPDLRTKLFKELKKLGATLPVIISDTAKVSRFSQLGEGTVVMHHSVINSGSEVGCNVIVNTGAIIEHDCVIGDHAQISTRSIVNGGVKVGHSCFIGSGAIIKQGVIIGEKTIVGAGAVVLKNQGNGLILIGNPARKLEK